MTRLKKSRKPSSISRKRTSADRNTLQKSKQRKGLKAGSRYNADNPQSNQNGSTQGKKTDSKIGSKVPIPLVARELPKQKFPKVSIKKVAPANVSLSAKQELEFLENDDKLNHLLDQSEAGVKLTDAEQHYLQTKLDRYHQLCEELGIETDELLEDDEAEEMNEWQQMLNKSRH